MTHEELLIQTAHESAKRERTKILKWIEEYFCDSHEYCENCCECCCSTALHSLRNELSTKDNLDNVNQTD